MATVSSRDIHEIVSKLSSDKTKIREEGMKLLNTWLGGERSIKFCRFLSRKTAMLRPDEIPGPETWPFLVTLLIDCTNKEILASKRRLPKLMFAKTLRIVVQRAHDSKSYGNNLPLIAAVKSLYNHIWDVLKDVPSFHSEYSIILRHFLAVHEYCFHMRNRVYSGLVRLYMEKVEPSVMEEDSCHSNNPKEEVFRCILTLHSLIENPPGDFPDHLREKVVEFFIEIFKSMREVGRISRKLIECLNSYLLKDGPNLGRQSLDVHKSVKRFVFDNWHIADRDLKDGFILYMKLQLHLMRVNEDEEDKDKNKDKDGIPLVEQLLELLSKELDQYSIPSVSASRSDASKDEKFGMLASSYRSLLELAALVFYRACVGVIKRPVAEKRARRENAAAYLQEQLTRGKWLWHAVFCHLCHSHQSRLPKELFACWFDGICSSLERILSDANVEHSYDGLLWTLRSLHHLSIVLLPLVSVEKDLLESSSISNKIFRGWQTVWSCLVHGFPKLSSITSVADAAFRLLGYLVSHDMLNMTEVPQDVWDLQCFRCISSPSALYFISCYFSRKGSQGDLRDNLYLRQNILRGVMSIINTRETLTLDEHVVILLPAALYAICVGVSIIKDHRGGFSSYCDDEAAGKEVDWLRVIYGDQQKHEESDEYFDCFVHTLAEINFDHQDKVPLSCNSRGVRLPRQLRDPLLNEMENCILYDLLDKKTEKNLSDIFLRCSLLSNILYGSVLTRQKDEISSFRAKLGNCLSDLIESAVAIVQGSVKDVKTHSFWSSNPSLDGTSSVVCFKSFLSCPIFSDVGKEIAVDPVFRSSIVLCIERLLKAFSNLYLEFSNGDHNLQGETVSPEVSSFSSSGDKPFSLEGSKSRLIDMELDVADESSDVVIDGTTGAGNFLTGSKLKVDTLSLMASCFSVLPMATWDILFDILSSERDSKVCERILYSLCQSPHWSSLAKLTNLVALVDEILELKLSLRLPCVDVLTTICCLLATLLYWRSNGKDEDGIQSMKERFDEKSLLPLGDLLNKVAESNLLDWFGRRKLVDCICDFIRLNPLIGQTMIQRLFILLKDPDYRVRFILARRIGILFLTWDGHDVLFQDICSNFGPKLIMCSKEKIVTEKEVWPDDYASHPIMETIVITLMHAAFHSEKVESEAIFMICVISAIGCCQRQLVKTVLDNLARKLHYACRSKYLEELMGPILFSWVTCGMSLFAFVQIMDLFGLDIEQNHFLLFCCPWLLPALVLHGDSANLQCLAELTRQSVPLLVRSHFVPVFSICMVLYCSKMAGWEKGSAALQSKILHFAEISEDERDMLIKKHMVTIVCQILSLASSASDTMVPLFSRKVVELAVRTVVDGFMELDNHSSIEGVVDKINVFRPDRVFMLLVELHYKVTAAVHGRHRSHRLAGIEVLISILGHRVAVPSTSCYLFNLIGQLISSPALQDQCCHMISILLKMFKTNPSRETTHILGEQLQFLVSKLVACCIPLGSNTDNSCTPSSQVLSLLHLLTVDSDPSLHDYIREFEPFPELEIFDRIRTFHLELCKDYSPRDHFLKFVKRSCHLPPRLLLWSLQAFHRKLLGGESFCVEENGGSKSVDNCWQSDLEIVQAVWSLVRICGSQDADARALVSDLISKVGIGDPRSVVFHLPGNLRHVHVCGASDGNYATVMNFELDAVTSEELLIVLIRNLKKYLMDDSVKIVDLSSRTLRGLLSTERGNRILGSFESYERSLIEVHSKGFNMQLVESILLDLQKKFTAEGKSLEESSLWKTSDKTFDSWICPLVYSLIGHCSDITLRLCQDIVLLKAEIAELLLPSIMINLAGRKDLATDFCHLISVKVEQHILVETNKLTKSIQAMLEVLNELRLCHVMERASTGSISNKQENSKASRSSSAQGAKSRASMKAQGSSTASWHKVYWLNVDYLTVAKSAILCGSYFTAMLYVEHWCEDHFKNLTLGKPDFSHVETLPKHIELLLSALTWINEPDGLYGIIQSHKLTSQILTFEHEGNWSKALKYYDLQVRLESLENYPKYSTDESCRATSCVSLSEAELGVKRRKPYKGVIKSLQQIGCAHTLDLYCQGLASCRGEFQHDLEFVELQYEAAWRSGNWDFSMFNIGDTSIASNQFTRSDRFNQNLHSCLRALQEGDSREYFKELKDSKQELALSLYHASEESTEYIYSTIVKLQILDHLGMTWDLRWRPMCNSTSSWQDKCNVLSEPTFPVLDELSSLNAQWKYIVKQTQLHMNLLEPFVAFRKVLLQILGCKDCTVQHLLQSSSVLRKGTMFSQAAASLHEFKFMCMELGGQNTSLYWHGRLEEAKLLRAQGRQEMAINLAKYIAEENQSNEDASDVHRLVGKWLAETRSSNSRTILEKYLKRAVTFAEELKAFNRKSVDKKCQAHFHLAHYADALFRSHEDRLNSSEWQAGLRLRKHKKMELDALIKRFRSSTKGEKTDYSLKIQDLQKQLALDTEVAEKLQDDRDKFLNLALDGYKHCLILGEKYDVRVVFRLVSIWFGLSSRQNVIKAMVNTVNEVQSYKFIPLVYQIASRMGSTKEVQGPHSFQFALASLVKKMAIEHPYHTLLQLLALANGDRIKDKQRSRNSYVVDVDKKVAAENLLKELLAHHGNVIRQMKQLVEIYIRLAELETRREDTNRKVGLPRDIRSVRELELVPVLTSNVSVDRSCQYSEGTFPYFKGLGDSVVVMNGINAPKVVECYGSDGKIYRQLAKSGNDDLRQDAVMEQFFGLVNTFLHNNQDTWKRKLGVRTYKVIPFTPSAGIIEWVDGTLPLGEYLIGSSRNGGAHGRYGAGDWSFSKCREHMMNVKDKRKAFQEVSENFRPVMHFFFLERFLQPADWFEKRLAYTRSVAASSMVGYIVGLGDRHSMNILIDQATAEVVHIDLGVAFEQGLMLKTPERVPFRLTRDIIDGMGVTGVEGVFRRCCEETLSVMRTNKEALLTIIEVFIHDPLYKWALSPLKALQRQKETVEDLETSWEDSQDECEGNKDAARALMRVKQKLDGYEDGEMRSVHGQVQQLIQDAIDPERLCNMFPGWGAWM